MKIVQGFIWLIVTDKAKEIYGSGLFDLYSLNGDDSESNITDREQLDRALEKGLEIAIEVGNMNTYD